MTEREVNATLAQSGGAAGAGAPAAAPRPAASTPPTAASAKSGSSGGAPRTLPKTASPLPVLALTGFASILAALALTVRRRRATP